MKNNKKFYTAFKIIFIPRSLSIRRTILSLLKMVQQNFFLNETLKVPKREIFNRSDFPDFYIIKSLCVGDFGVKINFVKKNN